MRAGLIAGAVLIAAGLFVIIKGVSYTREESVFKLGEFEAKMQAQHTVPEWLGGLALGAGIVLLVISARKR